jgi:hypothetical protein
MADAGRSHVAAGRGNMEVVMASLLKSRRAWALGFTVGLVLVVLWYRTAYYRGVLMAHIDHTCGHYEQKGHGLFPATIFSYRRLLHERYGVELRFVGGCLTSDELRLYASGYNSVSCRLLIAKYGLDIFEECERLALLEWKAEHLQEPQAAEP